MAKEKRAVAWVGSALPRDQIGVVECATYLMFAVRTINPTRGALLNRLLKTPPCHKVWCGAVGTRSGKRGNPPMLRLVEAFLKLWVRARGC